MQKLSHAQSHLQIKLGGKQKALRNKEKHTVTIFAQVKTVSAFICLQLSARTDKRKHYFPPLLPSRPGQPSNSAITGTLLRFVYSKQQCLLFSLMLTHKPLCQTWHIPAKQTSVAASSCLCLYMQPHLGKGKTLKEKHLSDDPQGPRAQDIFLFVADSRTKTNGAACSWPQWLPVAPASITSRDMPQLIRAQTG